MGQIASYKRNATKMGPVYLLSLYFLKPDLQTSGDERPLKYSGL